MDLCKVTDYIYKMISMLITSFSKTIFICLRHSDRVGGLGFSLVNIMEGVCNGVSVMIDHWISALVFMKKWTCTGRKNMKSLKVSVGSKAFWN